MINSDNFPVSSRWVLWAEVVFGKGWLQKHGKKRIVTRQEKLKAKFDNYDLSCILVCYASTHAVNTYQMLNPKMRKVMLTRDALITEWYFQEKKNKVKTKTTIKNEDEEESITAEEPSISVLSDDEDDRALNDAGKSQDH